MIVNIVQPQGIYKQILAREIVLNDLVNNSSVGILEHHLPAIFIIDNGFLKLTSFDEKSGMKVRFFALKEGICRFYENKLDILCITICEGKNKDEALNKLMEIEKEMLVTDQKNNMDYTKKERELYDSIKQSKAGRL